MDTVVVPGALPHEFGSRVKPAMEGQPRVRLPSREPVSAVSASQGLRPVDPLKKPPAALDTVLGVKLSTALRARIAVAAKADGLSDSAWLRQRALDRLGMESAVDAASGRRPRIPPAELEALAGVVREIGALHGPASLGKAGEVLAGLDKIRAVLIPICVNLGRGA